MLSAHSSFKTEQLKHLRVKDAYSEKQNYLEKLLQTKNLSFANLEIYLRAFKKENILEVWAKNKYDNKYTLLTTYNVCKASGTLGPKRKEGDMQVPEGFYYINHFNPESNYHLSLGINYPNPSDKVLADKAHPGGLIYIHGNCVTIGCLPITDDKIKELYILAVEARNNGQAKIPVTIFPMILNDAILENLRKSSVYNQDVLNLWHDLNVGYSFFERNKIPPTIEFMANGRHTIRE